MQPFDFVCFELCKMQIGQFSGQNPALPGVAERLRVVEGMRIAGGVRIAEGLRMVDTRVAGSAVHTFSSRLQCDHFISFDLKCAKCTLVNFQVKSHHDRGLPRDCGLLRVGNC